MTIKHLSISIIAILTFFIFYNCKKNENIITSEIVQKTHFLERISPSRGFIGSNIKISKKQTDSITVLDWSSEIIFRGSTPTYCDSCDGISLFVTVPFGGLSGPVEVKSGKVSDTLSYEVLDNYDTSMISIVWDNLSKEITDLSATPSYGGQNKKHWEASISGDTVTLSIYPNVGYPFFNVIRFIHQGNGQLPKFVDALNYVWEYGGHYLRRGVFKIAKWDTSSVVSGRMLVAPKDMLFNLEFYYDFRK